MILSREKIIERLKQGEVIHWMSGIDARAFMSGNIRDTVRWDTLCKLARDGIITSFAYRQGYTDAARLQNSMLQKEIRLLQWQVRELAKQLQGKLTFIPDEEVTNG